MHPAVTVQIMKSWQAEAGRSKAQGAQIARSLTALRAERRLRAVLHAWLEATRQLREEATAAARQQELFARVTGWLEK